MTTDIPLNRVESYSRDSDAPSAVIQAGRIRNFQKGSVMQVNSGAGKEDSIPLNV